MDKLRVLQRLASCENLTVRIFKAIADLSTTSLQRLKGLTTGGLPTFIDIGKNFGAPAIIEDNLLHQLSKNEKGVLMIGADTWMQLFPNHFNKSYLYPSFNVKDLDTVDNGCVEHLLPSLHKDDWDVLIAHFLGVVSWKVFIPEDIFGKRLFLMLQSTLGYVTMKLLRS